jgi:hypothetical protein
MIDMDRKSVRGDRQKAMENHSSMLSAMQQWIEVLMTDPYLPGHEDQYLILFRYGIPVMNEKEMYYGTEEN